MRLRVGAVFIPVLNLESSIQWYTDCLGLQLVDNWESGASFTFQNGEALLALIQVECIQPLEFPTSGTGAPSNVYFHFETDDLEQTRAYLENKGVEVTQYYDHGMMNELFIKDPSGNQIAIFCEKEQSPFYKHATGKISW